MGDDCVYRLCCRVMRRITPPHGQPITSGRAWTAENFCPLIRSIPTTNVDRVNMYKSAIYVFTPYMAPDPRTRKRTQNFLSRASGKVCSARVREVGCSSACVREFTNTEILVRLAREHFSCSAHLFANCS